MAKHSVKHSFYTDEKVAIVQFDLIDGKVDGLILHFTGTEIMEISPGELIDLAATINQAAEWVMAIGLKEDNDGIQDSDNKTD